MTRAVLVLRPEPGNSQTVERLNAKGIAALPCPLFAVSALEWQAPSPEAFDALLITSANAIGFAGTALADYRHLPVHAVGKASAEAAREAGFHIASVGSDDSASLVSQVEELRLLHLCGADVTSTAVPTPRMTQIPVYESRALDQLQGLSGALASKPIALLHSTRAALRFAELVDAFTVSRSSIAIAAISAKAAAAAGSGWQRLAIAEEPRDEAIIDLAEQLFRDLRDT